MDNHQEDLPEEKPESKLESEQEKEEAKEVNAEEQDKSNQEDFKSKFYYLAAEMENQRRRYEREKEQTIKYGNQQILTDLLEVLDNFDRSVDAIVADKDEKVKNISVGLKMVQGQFFDILSRYGLTCVESMGEIFNPQFHEAMGRRPLLDKKDDEIVEVYQKGYCLNGRLIRSAKVIVAERIEKE